MLVQSKFNFRCRYKEDLFLYNSYVGKKSILKISDPDTQKEISDFFDEKKKDIPKDIEEILIENGYLVPEELDEFERVNGAREKIIDSEKVTVTIIPTSGCNFKCVYCYEEMCLQRMSNQTIEDMISFINKVIEGKKILFVNWFGGEPLLEIEKIEIITAKIKEICKKQKVRFLAGATTNGYLLNLANFRRLLRCNIVDYQVTIDGLREDHNQLRMLKTDKGSYDVIIENLYKISKEVKSGFFSISVRCNFLRNSMNKYEEILDNFAKLFGGDKRFSFTIHAVKDWGGESVNNLRNELLSEEEEKNLLKLAMLYSKNNEMKIDFLSHLSVLDGNTNSCYAMGRSNYVIGADGTIYKCTSDFETPLGNVKNPEEIETWIKEEEMMKTPADCRRCFFYGACKRSICPKAIKVKEKMCPLEKDCIPDLLGSIPNEVFAPTLSQFIYQYKEELINGR